MKKPKSQWRWLAKSLAYLLAATCLFGCLLSTIMAGATSSAGLSPAWATPAAMALKRAGAINSVQHEPNFLSNLDCSLMEYRLSDGKTMQTGCFAPTAFGFVDVDSGVVVFNGTDEGLSLLPYSSQQGIVPWPEALSVITLTPVSTGGSYIGMYRNPLASLLDQRDSFGRLIAKQLTAPPDLSLKDPSGNLLVVNPQTMAFSDNGSWLVVETLNGSFVRINLSTLEVIAFAPAFGTTGSPGLLKSQVAVSGDGRYVAINNDAASVFRVYDLGTCDGVVANLVPQKCEAYDYLPFVRQQVTDFHSLRHLRFIDSGLLSFDVRANDPAGDGAYELAPSSSITSLIDYLALGDSYTSGEGAFDYVSGTDTVDDMCHLSIHSYPLLLTRALFSSSGGHSVACSGAVINDVGSTSSSYRGQVRGVATLGQLEKTQPDWLDSIMAGYLPGYVAQQRFVRQYRPAIVSVSVGGDDIGFGDIVKNCVMPHVALHSGNNTCYNSYEDRVELTNLVDRTVPRWSALFRQLVAEGPDTRLYAIGYPQIADSNGSCGLNVHLDKSELEFSGELIDYLNNGIRQAATAAGVAYVDISQALAGHRLCEAASYAEAVNGLTAGNDGSVLGIRIFGKESYHPNAFGQALIEQTILEQTHNLAIVPIITAVTSSRNILNAPKTGRPINTLVPDDRLTSETVGAGENFAVQATGVRDGLKASAAYAVKLDGVGGPLLGTVMSDSQGNISTSLSLPANTAAGGHTIDIIGASQANEPIDVTQPVYVPASSADTDGDGIDDKADSCPGAINSGQDSDHDGVDDTCDPSINPPLLVEQGGSSGQGGASGSNSLSSSGQGSDLVSSTSQLNSIVTSFALDTTNPPEVSSLGVKAALPLTYLGPKIVNRPLTRLPIIHWLPWVLLPLIPWLLILLVVYLSYFIGRGIRDD